MSREADGAESSGRHWFEDLADHMGPAYLRYSFTKGTAQEVDFLIAALQLPPGSRVLDLGCGPGRHSLEFARRGMAVTGVDISETFVQLASSSATEEGLDATFVRADARSLPLAPSKFDLAISLCQGGFGLLGGEGSTVIDPDVAVLASLGRAIQPEGRVVVSAFSSYFQVRHLDDVVEFDAASGVNLEDTEVRDSDGVARPAQLWTTCYTPRELRLAATVAGLRADEIWSVEPGRYAADAPTVDSPEYLLVARLGGIDTG